MSKQDNSLYQLGEHSINSDTTMGGVEIPVKFESNAIFKRLASDIYESAEAGIREPLQNAITAVNRAVNEGYIEEDERLIQIKIQDGEQVSLTIRDNGLGISKEEIKEVLSYIGRSQNRDKGEMSGKYGMGFLACYTLVGVDGGFIMNTKSRKTDNEIKGVWKPAMFELDKNDKLPTKFDNGYGTELSFNLESSLSFEQVKEWVYAHCENAKTPILYQEYDDDYMLVEDEEFGLTDMSEKHLDETPCVIDYDTEYYRAIVSPVAESKTYLLNSPIKRNSKVSEVIGDTTFEYDIRLKNENGVVVKGPHKGKMPVNKMEYETMSESRKENYIPINQLQLPQDKSEVFDDNIDIVLPQPIGTRDKLNSEKYFWVYLNNILEQEIRDEFKSLANNIESKETFKNLSITDKNRFVTFLDYLRFIQSYKVHTAHIKKKFDEYNITNYSTDVIEFIRKLQTKVNIFEKDEDRRKTNIYKVIQKMYEQNKVFMGVSINNFKKEIVFDENKQNIIVQLKDTSFYDDGEQFLNWFKLKDVKNVINTDNLSKGIKEKLQNKNTTKKSVNKDILERNITIHMRDKKTRKRNVKRVKELYADSDKTLVLFPSNTNKKLTDYKSIINTETTHIANCLVKMYDYLKDCENIMHISEYIYESKQSKLQTTESVKTIQEVLTDDSKPKLFLYVKDKHKTLFESKNILSKLSMITDIPQFKEQLTKLDKSSYDNSEIIIVNEKSLRKIKTIITHNQQENENSIDDIDSLFLYSNNYKIPHELLCGTRMKLCNNYLYVYMHIQLPEWSEMGFIEKYNLKKYELNESFIELVDNIKQKYNNNMVVYSETPQLINPLKNISYMTDNGELTAYEIKNNYEKVIVYVTSERTKQLYKTKEQYEKSKKYIIENQNRFNIEKQEMNNSILVIVSESEKQKFKKLMRRFDKNFSKKYKFMKSVSRKIPEEASVYAASILEKEEYIQMIDYDCLDLSRYTLKLNDDTVALIHHLKQLEQLEQL